MWILNLCSLETLLFIIFTCRIFWDLFPFISGKNDLRILDVGCGTGLIVKEVRIANTMTFVPAMIY